MNDNQNIEKQAHPFELAGMGLGPYKFVGMVSIPSTSLLEANPEAYNNAMRMLPTNLVGGCGTCSCCGMAIMNICIVQDAQGRRYGVGSDCVMKTGQKSLGDPAKIAVAEHQRQQRFQREAAKREAGRKVWLAEVCNDRGETNAQRLERESQERVAAEKVREEERAARTAQTIEKFGFLLPILDSCSRTDGDFCYNMADRIRHGNEITGRALDIVAEIYAKQGCRRNSKAYEEAYSDFYSKIGEPQPEIL